MIYIANIDAQKFSLNGIPYFKNFTPYVIGTKLKIINTYDSSFYLTEFDEFGQYSVDGVIHTSVANLQSALLPVLFSRGDLGSGGGGGDFIPRLGTIEGSPVDGNIVVNQDKKIIFKDESGGLVNELEICGNNGENIPYISFKNGGSAYKTFFLAKNSTGKSSGNVFFNIPAGNNNNDDKTLLLSVNGVFGDSQGNLQLSKLVLGGDIAELIQDQGLKISVIGKGIYSEIDFSEVEETNDLIFAQRKFVNNRLDEKENAFINSGATILIPQRGQANYTYIGIAAASTVHVGLTARSIASTNYFTLQNRVGYVTSAVAGNIAHCRQAVDGIVLNQNFDCPFMFGKSLAVAGQRSYIGYTADGTFTPSNVEPTTLLNCCGITELSSSTNWHIIHNDGSGTATTIDLGFNFPANTSSTDVYAAFFTKISGGVNIKVNRISPLGVVVNSVNYNITTDLPSASSVLYWRWWTTNNTIASPCSIDIFRIKNGY